MTGFLPFSRASFMIDFIFVALLAILPVLYWSVRCAIQGDYERHRKLQIIISIALFVAVLLFELEMRLVGWTHHATSSPFFTTWVYPSLYLHLVFAIPTTLLWFYTVIWAYRRFPQPPKPVRHARRHKTLGKLAASGMVGTSLTGFLFFALAFVA